jgi:hypothetical protein
MPGGSTLTAMPSSATKSEMGMGLPENRREGDSSCEQEALDGRLTQGGVRDLATIHCRNKRQ